jgi:hypothetical protein
MSRIELSRAAEALGMKLEVANGLDRSQLESYILRNVPSDMVVEVLNESYSPGTKMFLDAQRKANPGKLLREISEQHEEAIKKEKVAEEARLFANKPCKCGATAGCMCPREPVVEDKPPCEHRFIVLIPRNIAAELGADPKDHPGSKIYACRDCHKVLFNAWPQSS